ncbi:MAG: glycosyltransferase family 4 protein [Chloroflexi bacterium]|nr:glycosyltransferase family 4 protein [Chloroflexota bacterium]
MNRIGLDARLTAYRAGGTSTYIRALASAIVDLNPPEQLTIVQSRRAKELLEPRLPHLTAWTPPHHRLERIALSAELLRGRFDVLHSPDFIPPWRGGRRHVITVHDLAFLRYPDQMTADSQRYYNDQIAWAVEHADHILAVSNATRDDLIKLLNVPLDRITVQYHGVDPAFHPLKANDIAKGLAPFDLTPGYLLFVGTIGPRKNIEGLCEGYRIARESITDIPLLAIVGEEGWLAERSMAAIRSTPGVIHIPGAPWSAFPALYSGARALLLPAYYEGFGLPALEAMACGTVPIVSDRGSLPEVVDGVGLLVNPDDPQSIADAISRVAGQDAAWLDDQREAGLKRASRFTWERSARIALETYRRVVAA